MTMIRKDIAAQQVGGDPLEFVMSDSSVDRYGDVIDARGWDLKDFRRNPVALFGHDGLLPIGKWSNVRVEGDRLLGRLELVEAVSDRLKEIHALVRAGVLRAVSVGFRPIQHEPLGEKGGRRYLKQALLECSLVSVPANANALSVARSLHVSDDTIRTVFGKPAGEDGTVVRQCSGESAAIYHHTRQKLMNLSQRIEAAQTDLNAARDQLTEHIGGEEQDHDPIVIDELSNRIEEREKALAALKRAETALAVRAAPPPPVVTAPAVQTRRPLGIPVKEVRPSDHIFRAAVVHAVSHVSGKDHDTILNKLYPEDEATAIITKAAVAGAMTSVAGWAQELVQTSMASFLEVLRPVSIYPRLAAAGQSLTFGPMSGNIKIPSRASTPSIGGSFVGEGAAIPVRRLGLTSITLSPKKMGVISVFSREIARYASPAIEGILRQEITADTAITLDSLLLDNVAASAIRPAGLLNGVSGLTPTAGGGATAILGDIKKLLAPFRTANATGQLVMLLNPAQDDSIALTPGSDGTLGWVDPVINERFQKIVSTNVPAGTVIVIDAADFVTATGDTPEFETSDQAVIHMEDTNPLQIGTVGSPATVAAPSQSMYQTAQIAIRMLLDVSWAMRRTGSVQFVSGVTW